MSKRPINKKAANRVRKAMRNDLPSFFDLVQWLIDHGHARTVKEANELILDKRVKADSHTLGVDKTEVFTPLTALQLARGVEAKLEEKEIVQRYVTTAVRGRIMVL